MVLICMSQKYKDSPNCRLEGEYCMNRKIPFVPLMMQQGYSPDGWYHPIFLTSCIRYTFYILCFFRHFYVFLHLSNRLGITLGSKLWYSFADDSNWDSKMKELTKGTSIHRRPLVFHLFSFIPLPLPTLTLICSAIGDRGRGATSSPPKPVPGLASPTPTPSNQKQVVDWNAQGISSIPSIPSIP